MTKSPSIAAPNIQFEEARLKEILKAIVEYSTGRQEQLAKHQNEINLLKQQRLDSASWSEKNSLTEKIRDKENYDPNKYLPVFQNAYSPYFASFKILDEDPGIGSQEYLLGKQSLFKDSKVLIVDWRQSAISSLYYEYEEGEEYEEEINGRERLGTLTQKTRYTITDSELTKIETSGQTQEKKSGKWIKSTGDTSTSKIKEEFSDHNLCDIVSLISPEQFRLITKEYHGCLMLQGSAGAGKTTIALHRLSYLTFNYPEKFRPERCMVLMFNRALRDYVSATVAEMSGTKTNVETFHSWAAKSLKSLGLKKISFGATVPASFDILKKSNGMSGLIEDYASNATDAVAIEHLYRMYSSEHLMNKYLSTGMNDFLLKSFTSYYENKLKGNSKSKSEISFSDAGIILRLFQIRTKTKNPALSTPALNYFDHLVIDEAQDFSQIELDCLVNATTQDKSLTICADPNQQILNYIDTTGLTNFQLRLEKNGVSSEKLQISYRSTQEIMEVANSILNLSPGEGTRTGEPVFFGQYKYKEDALLELEKLVLQYQDKSPNGLIAVICKFKSDVNFIYQKLHVIKGVRKDPQRFQPGVLITNAHQVKGLEFTSVIIWDASTNSYKQNNVNDRNLLYVAASRACDRLAILCHKIPTTYLLPFFSGINQE